MMLEQEIWWAGFTMSYFKIMSINKSMPSGNSHMAPPCGQTVGYQEADCFFFRILDTDNTRTLIKINNPKVMC